MEKKVILEILMGKTKINNLKHGDPVPIAHVIPVSWAATAPIGLEKEAKSSAENLEKAASYYRPHYVMGVLSPAHGAQHQLSSAVVYAAPTDSIEFLI